MRVGKDKFTKVRVFGDENSPCFQCDLQYPSIGKPGRLFADRAHDAAGAAEGLNDASMEVFISEKKRFRQPAFPR